MRYYALRDVRRALMCVRHGPEDLNFGKGKQLLRDRENRWLRER